MPTKSLNSVPERVSFALISRINYAFKGRQSKLRESTGDALVNVGSFCCRSLPFSFLFVFAFALFSGSPSWGRCVKKAGDS